MLSVVDTANIEMWFTPKVSSGTRIKRMSDGAIYEVIGEPESVEQRNQILKFKVHRVKGCA